MTIATTETNEMGAFNENDEQMLRYLGLNPSSPADRAMVAVCRAYDFDPVLKHVVVIPKGGVYITRDGLLHVAHRSGQLDGIVVDQDPALVDGEWVAKVSVYRKDMRHPFTYPGRYSATGGNRQYAQEMALKAAEAHALRRAFDVTGLPTIDEQRLAPTNAPAANGTAAERMAAVLAPPTSDPELAQPDDTTPPGEPSNSGPESPLLNTSGGLAKSMFATLNDAGITERDDRLAYVSQVVGREVTSSAAMTDADAVDVIAALQAVLTEPFPAKGVGDE